MGLANVNVVYLKEYFQEGNKVRFWLCCDLRNLFLGPPLWPSRAAIKRAVQCSTTKLFAIVQHSSTRCCVQQSQLSCKPGTVLPLQPCLAALQKLTGCGICSSVSCGS